MGRLALRLPRHREYLIVALRFKYKTQLCGSGLAIEARVVDGL